MVKHRNTTDQPILHCQKQLVSHHHYCRYPHLQNCTPSSPFAAPETVTVEIICTSNHPKNGNEVIGWFGRRVKLDTLGHFESKVTQPKSFLILRGVVSIILLQYLYTHIRSFRTLDGCVSAGIDCIDWLKPCLEAPSKNCTTPNCRLGWFFFETFRAKKTMGKPLQLGWPDPHLEMRWPWPDTKLPNPNWNV